MKSKEKDGLKSFCAVENVVVLSTINEHQQMLLERMYSMN